MKKVFGSAFKVSAIALAICASTAASAQTAGSWAVELGIDHYTPKSSSGDMSAPSAPGSKFDIGSDTQPFVAATYMVSDHIAVEAQLSAPFRQDLTGSGSIGGSRKLGSVRTLLPSVFAQYRFGEAQAAFRPYLGAGLSYAYFHKESGSGALTALTNTGSASPTTFQLDNTFGLGLQAGATFAFNDRWFADAAVTKTFLKTTVHYSTRQSQDLKLDPLSIRIAVGYRF
ncbi:outer membrane protein OmpW [soil metagenome]